ncbi:MAG TPA: hypothetical protein VD884_14345 [Ohtaekwangia sp.]|nr:hypothetical protein [Ohtaekwangia sp.]
MKSPTDLQILNAIYDMYYDTFTTYSRGKDVADRVRISKIHVPIDLDKLGQKLGVDGDIIFGRLYYHLNNKHGYRMEHPAGPDRRGSRVDLFVLQINNGDVTDIHTINFPFLAAVLADLRDQNKRNLWTIWIALGALIVSLLTTWISVLWASC